MFLFDVPRPLSEQELYLHHIFHGVRIKSYIYFCLFVFVIVLLFFLAKSMSFSVVFRKYGPKIVKKTNRRILMYTQREI